MTRMWWCALAVSLVGCVMGPDQFTGDEEAVEKNAPGAMPNVVGVEGSQEPGLDQSGVDQSNDGQTDQAEPGSEPGDPGTEQPAQNRVLGHSTGDKGHGSPQPLVPQAGDESRVEKKE